jgi:hypothetical protein
MKMPDLKKYLVNQDANRIAGDAMAKAAGPSTSRVVSRPVCLVTNFAERADVPVGTLLIKMAPKVVDALVIMGLHEPVSLKLLPGLWWAAQADVSTDNPNYEAGGATTEVITTTAMLAHHYSYAYCEVTDGPYASRNEVDGCFFATEEFDHRRLGKNARVLVIPTWSAKRLAGQGTSEPIPASTLSGKWWVCGLGGGVCSTESLAMQVNMGYRITDGPFESEKNADYAFDVLWESPE